MDETKILAEFAASISYDRLPRATVEKAKHCVLDFFANVYGSLQIDAVARVVERYRRRGEGGRASVLGARFTAPAQTAAFLNGVTAEALEAQDGLRFGGNHPGVAVIPAALALAEERGLSGRKVIEAVVAGYEVAGRTGAAVHPHQTLSGFLPTGACGVFGAAAAASKLLGHGPDLMLQSLGIAGYVAPLSMAEHLMGGFTSKILQGGQAALSGLAAAELADAGLTGAPYVLEGSQLGGGFVQITTRGGADLSRITGGLGEGYSIDDIYFKPYTACRHTHGAAQATLALRRDKSFSLDAIEAVDVYTYMLAGIAVGKGVDRDSSFVSAQFSLPYVVAACLIDGDMGPAQFRPERVSDEAILALASRVNVHPDEELSAMYPACTASRVEIKLAGGRVLKQQIETPKGDPRDPMSARDLTEKLERFSPADKRGDAAGIAARTLALDDIDDIRTLISQI
jgi:2-methylcitrate dehydratase PrpD